MNKIKKGFLFGAIAGAIDVIPMFFMKIPLSACLSAYTMWVVIGISIGATDLHIKRVLKGILASFLILAPTAVLIIAGNLYDIIPVFIMTLILGGLLGYFIERVPV